MTLNAKDHYELWRRDPLGYQLTTDDIVDLGRVELSRFLALLFSDPTYQLEMVDAYMKAYEPLFQKTVRKIIGPLPEPPPIAPP